MDKNLAYAIARGYGFAIVLSLPEMELLLEAFTNWMDTDNEQWTEDGEAVNPEYKMIIHKLQHRITELKGG